MNTLRKWERRKRWDRSAGRNRFSIGATAFAASGTISSRGSPAVSRQSFGPVLPRGRIGEQPGAAALFGRVERAARHPLGERLHERTCLLLREGIQRTAPLELASEDVDAQRDAGVRARHVHDRIAHRQSRAEDGFDADEPF